MDQQARLDPVIMRTKPWKVDSMNFIRIVWKVAKLNFRILDCDRLDSVLDIMIVLYMCQPENMQGMSKQLLNSIEIHVDVNIIEGVGFVFKLDANANERIFPKYNKNNKNAELVKAK